MHSEPTPGPLAPAPSANPANLPDPKQARRERRAALSRQAHVARHTPVVDAQGVLLEPGAMVLIPAQVLEVRSLRQGQFAEVRCYDGTIFTLRAAATQLLKPDAAASGELGQPFDEQPLNDLLDPEGDTGAEIASTNGDLSDDLVVTEDFEPSAQVVS